MSVPTIEHAVGSVEGQARHAADIVIGQRHTHPLLAAVGAAVDSHFIGCAHIQGVGPARIGSHGAHDHVLGGGNLAPLAGATGKQLAIIDGIVDAGDMRCGRKGADVLQVGLDHQRFAHVQRTDDTGEHGDNQNSGRDE